MNFKHEGLLNEIDDELRNGQLSNRSKGSITQERGQSWTQFNLNSQQNNYEQNASFKTQEDVPKFGSIIEKALKLQEEIKKQKAMFIEECQKFEEKLNEID